jgi:hypothetical protein
MTAVALRPGRTATACVLLIGAALGLPSCGNRTSAGPAPRHVTARAAAPAGGTTSPRAPAPGPVAPGGSGPSAGGAGPPLPAPAALAPLRGPALAGQGAWRPVGRPAGGVPAVYETTLIPPGGTQPAGIAWMDTRVLAARLYSGSISPGGGPYRYTAPIAPAQARSLVAAFNGGFQMKDGRGGYYTERRMVDPLRPGAASLVISADGSVTVGAWGRDVTMTPHVVSVRQNLVPLVADGRPAVAAASRDWQAWGSTCGATSCLHSVPGIEHQWRSGVGVTADGALVYVTGPALSPLQLAELLARAGVIRGMQLDINPAWTVFITYHPAAGGFAAPANGSKLLPATVQGPWTFFTASWARDFVTMSARTAR